MARKDDIGRAGEVRAGHYLEGLGYAIADRNWRARGGEIDLVVLGDDAVIVVEVKTRSGRGFGHPFEAIDARKRARLWRLGMAWLGAHPDVGAGRRLRIDAVGLIGRDPERAEIEHLRDLDI
ncbi:YraN family protein [Microbacterium chocolatum]|uniref:YraN family protein n=1 Tax=Microbacterium aurantiacum TaxID=162393 RepID=UPI0033905A93